MQYHDFWPSDLYLVSWPTLKKNCPRLWLLNQRGYLLLLFTYGCRRRAMLSSLTTLVFFSYDKTSLKLCEIFRIFLALFTEKFPKIGYLNYVKRRVVSMWCVRIKHCKEKLFKAIKWLNHRRTLTGLKQSVVTRLWYGMFTILVISP